MGTTQRGTEVPLAAPEKSCNGEEAPRLGVLVLKADVLPPKQTHPLILFHCIPHR